MSEKSEILKAAIEEQRFLYGHISTSFGQLRVKALALIAGEVAIVSFIFAGDSQWLLNRPDTIVLFSFGVLCLLVAFGMLLWTISTVVWKNAHGYVRSEELLKKYKKEEDFLSYLNTDYANINMHNATVVTPKLKRFNWIVYLLSTGAIIVLVIKYGGIQLW